MAHAPHPPRCQLKTHFALIKMMSSEEEPREVIRPISLAIKLATSLSWFVHLTQSEVCNRSKRTLVALLSQSIFLIHFYPQSTSSHFL